MKVMLCSVGFLHQKWPIWKKKKSAEIAILRKNGRLEIARRTPKLPLRQKKKHADS
jgi:hypothetical protein